jgi:hypothetical protein
MTGEEHMLATAPRRPHLTGRQMDLKRTIAAAASPHRLGLRDDARFASPQRAHQLPVCEGEWDRVSGSRFATRSAVPKTFLTPAVPSHDRYMRA